MTVLGDRDRIARVLHNLVIQRLFSNGLTLQSALARLVGPQDSIERIQQALDDLDTTIKVIRSTPSTPCASPTAVRPVACARSCWPRPTGPPRRWASPRRCV